MKNDSKDWPVDDDETDPACAYQSEAPIKKLCDRQTMVPWVPLPSAFAVEAACGLRRGRTSVHGDPVLRDMYVDRGVGRRACNGSRDRPFVALGVALTKRHPVARFN